MTKQKDKYEFAKSIIDEIIGVPESENWCKTLEPKKAKAGRAGDKKRAADPAAEERPENTGKVA